MSPMNFKNLLFLITNILSNILYDKNYYIYTIINYLLINAVIVNNKGNVIVTVILNNLDNFSDGLNI